MNKRITNKLFAILILLLCGCALPEQLPPCEDNILSNHELAQLKLILGPKDPAAQQPAARRFEKGTDKPLDLSVEQAMVLALQNNQDLRVGQINPLMAGAFEKIERGVYDPEFFAELEFTREKRNEPDQNGTLTEVEEDGNNAVIGLRKKLTFGTTVEAAVEHELIDADREPRAETARLGLSITQSLLRGFGPAVNLVKVRQARLNTTATIHELRGMTEALLADTETAYWNYVLARQKIEIFENSQAIALQQLDEIRQRIEVGILPKIEAAAAQAEVARRQQALIDARSQLEEKRLRLLRLTNPAGDGQLDIPINATSQTAIDPQPITDLHDRLQLARQSRPDLNEARLRQQQDRLETITTRNGLLPKLDLFISLGKTGYGESFSDSFRKMDENTHDYSVGIRLSHFIGNRQAEGRDLVARATWQQTTEALKNLEQIVDLDVRLAANEAERTRQLIAATKATRILQEETLKAEKERFEVGATTALLVAQAQRDLLTSAIDEVESVVNYRQALISLYLVEGSLLERRGIELSN
ncbi:MAG: TolC family protein [Proteobacteria bacterium]|nr:TolC family protein [Pseudomonadota bacterium]MBU1714886.1 TolC family protein [Pseudomonadota bacterium]